MLQRTGNHSVVRLEYSVLTKRANHAKQTAPHEDVQEFAIGTGHMLTSDHPTPGITILAVRRLNDESYHLFRDPKELPFAFDTINQLRALQSLLKVTYTYDLVNQEAQGQLTQSYPIKEESQTTKPDEVWDIWLNKEEKPDGTRVYWLGARLIEPILINADLRIAPIAGGPASDVGVLSLWCDSHNCSEAEPDSPEWYNCMFHNCPVRPPLYPMRLPPHIPLQP